MAFVSRYRLNGKRRSLALSTLLAAATAVMLLPFILVGAGAVYKWQQNRRDYEIARLSEYAAALAANVDRELRGQTETAVALSYAPSLRTGDFKTFWENASDVAKAIGAFFVLIDPPAQQVVNTLVPFTEALPKTASTNTIQKVIETGRPVVGDMVIGAATRKWGFSIRVPVLVDGVPRYVLSLVPRSELMPSILRSSALPEGWLAVILDGNGVIVARSLRHEDFLGVRAPYDVSDVTARRAGVLEAKDLEGRSVVAAYHGSAISDWSVFVWAPKHTLNEPAAEGFLFVLFGLLGLLLLVALIALLASRLIRSPNQYLLETAAALGDSKKVTFEPTLMKEANTLGAALLKAGQTIHDRDAHTRFVMRELSHRSKNLLTVVLAIASQSSRTSKDSKDFIAKFRERLGGLSRSHDLLVNGDWGSVPMGELVHSQTGLFTAEAAHRIMVEGPEIMLNPQAAQSLGLALHELSTNSTKHGSWSVPTGFVRVTWEIRDGDSDAPEVVFRWIEDGGPPVAQSRTNGFGNAILARLAPSSVNGKAELHWRTTGLEWRLTAPLSELSA